jgi:DNA/RNA endonuclease YhcR with UshA esterase domain
VSWSSSNAVNHIGERGTVCGPIVDTRYATGTNGKPTFLNFDRNYPNHTMVVLIWDSNRSAFPSNPEDYYKGKKVCATGLIESYKGKPQIIARDSNQLELQR